MPPAHPRWARHTLSVAASAVRHTGRDLVSVGPLCLPWTEPHREDDSLMTHIRRARGATLAGLVVSALALTTVMSACSSQTPATASATSRMTARPTSTARSTAKPSATKTAASTVASTGAETPEQAAAEVAKALAAQAAAAAKPGSNGKALREAVYTDKALAAATAEGKLVTTLTAEQKADLALSPTDPVVLAVSRTAAYPRTILAKATLAGSGAQVLVTLTSSAADAGYRIAAIARLLPSAAVGKFDAVTAGSPPVGDGAGFAITPDAFLEAYAGALAFPAPAASELPFGEDPFFTTVRKAAADQASALGPGVTLKQTHAPAGVVAALRAAPGQGAYVVAILERKDTLTPKPGKSLAPSKAFSILAGKSTVTKSATLRTYEFVVVHIPTVGKATVVAADEQVFAASGS